MMNGKFTFSALAALMLAAGCQRNDSRSDYDKAIWECDSVIADYRAALDRDSSYNVCTGLTYGLVEALEQKDSILWWKLMERSTGDEKLFLYQQFQYHRELYRKFCDQNDSLVYHKDKDDPWWQVYSNNDKIDWLERHIRILQQQTK